MTGCNTNDDILENKDNQNKEDVQNNNDLSSDNSLNESMVPSGESTYQDKELTEEQLVQKYKISDSYVLKEEEIQQVSYDILKLTEGKYDYAQGKHYDIKMNFANQEVISVGTNLKIECYQISEDKVEVKTNDEILETDYYDLVRRVGHLSYDCVCFGFSPTS